MNQPALHNQDIAEVQPALPDQALGLEAAQLDPTEQQLMATEQPVLSRFNRLPNPRRAMVMLAGSAVVGAFIEGYSVNGSTTRGFIHAGAELGGKAMAAASDFFSSPKVL